MAAAAHASAGELSQSEMRRLRSIRYAFCHMELTTILTTFVRGLQSDRFIFMVGPYKEIFKRPKAVNEVRPGSENYSGFERRFQQNKDKKDSNI